MPILWSLIINKSKFRIYKEKMSANDYVIKGLWIGTELSPNELLSINSYLFHGHQYELFTYSQICNVPEGVIIKNANEIIPESEIFTFTLGRHNKSLSMFSDLFRYRLLYLTGGWWSDLDMICLKPYDFDQDYVFAQEKHRDGRINVNGSVIKAPISAPIMSYCYDYAKEQSKSDQNMKWAATGPILLDKAVGEFQLTDFVVPINFFTPIGYYEIQKFFTELKPDPVTYSIHLYNEIWGMYHISKRGIYPKNSLFESLKKQYSIRNNYLGLILEFFKDINKDGLKRGSKTIYGKIAYMYRTFKNMSSYV